MDGSAFIGSGFGLNDTSTTLTNDSFRCGLPPYFPPSLNIPEIINYVQACIALILGVIGFSLNLFILFMITAYKSLHQRLMYLALHIVIIDLVYTVTIPPVIFTSGVSGEWLLGLVMCNILGMIHDFFVLFRFSMTLILTLERFISVFWPFFYRRNSRKIILTLLPVVFIVSILRVVIPSAGIFDCFLYVPTQKTCTAFSGCSTECFYFIVVSSLVIVTFTMILPFVLYIVLFCKTRSVKRRSRSVIGSVVASSILTSSLRMNGEAVNGKLRVPSRGSADISDSSSNERETEANLLKSDIPCSGTSNRVFEFTAETRLDSDATTMEQSDSKVVKTVDSRSRIDSADTVDSDTQRVYSSIPSCSPPSVNVYMESEQIPTAGEVDLERTSLAEEVDLEQTTTTREVDLERAPTAKEVDLDRASTAEEADSERTSSAGEVDLERAPTPERSDSVPDTGINRHQQPETETQELRLHFHIPTQITPRPLINHQLHPNGPVETQTSRAYRPGWRRPSTVSFEDTEQIMDFASSSNRLRLPRLSEVSILSTFTRRSSEVKFGSSNLRVNITMFILLMSVIGCTTPAWLLYGIQFLYLEPEPILFIVNMMVGRTFFNLIPVIDAIAVMRHREFKLAMRQFFSRVRRTVHC